MVHPHRASPAIFILVSLGCSLPSASLKAPLSAPPSQTGIASWYGPGFHGRSSASGKIYDQNELTAAHRTLPLGTRVLVTNLENGKWAEVTITDRGPFVEGRVIDLSYAAARALDMIGPGTIPVRIEVRESPHRLTAIPESLTYTLQVGAFADFDNAQKLKAKLAGMYPGAQVSIVRLPGKDSTYYRVQLGAFTDRDEAERQAREVASRGFSVVIMEK